MLATNITLSLNQGATAPITTSQLKVTDGDNLDSELTFTIGTGVAHGTLTNTHTTTTLSSGSTFTEQDLDNGYISYTNNGSANASDSFTFTVSDGTDSIGPYTFNITVASAPIFGNSTYSGTVNTQTSANGTLVTTVSATAQGNDTISYSLSGTGNSTFFVAANGAITVANEAAVTGTAYSLTVEATDTVNHQTANAAVNITILSPPVFGQPSYSFGLLQTANAGTAVGNVSATPESGDTLGYSLSGTGNSNFAISSNGAITVANGASLASSNYNLTITAKDNQNNDTSSAQLTIFINTQPPVFGNSTYSGTVNTQTSANGTPVVSVSATGQGNDTIAYSLSGTGNSAFAVAANGAITVANEAAITGTSYSLTVEATDTINNDTANATVNIAVKSPPVFGNSTYSGSVNTQTSANGTAVVSVSATPEAGDSVTYSLSGTGNSAFAVAANGAITVANEAAISGTSYSLTVEATDTINGDTANATVNIAVKSPPVFGNSTYSGSVNTQTSANGTAVVSVSATPETGDSVTYSLSGTGNSAFAVAANGAISVANEAAITGTSYSLTVKATDTINGDTANATVNIAVKSPPVFGNSTYSGSVNTQTSANGTAVVSVSATPETGDSVTYSLSGTGRPPSPSRPMAPSPSPTRQPLPAPVIR